MIATRTVEGLVEFNDGEFAEVQTYGIEGIEKDLLLRVVQICLRDTGNTSEEFQRRFPVGTRVEIVTSTEIVIKNSARPLSKT